MCVGGGGVRVAVGAGGGGGVGGGGGWGGIKHGRSLFFLDSNHGASMYFYMLIHQVHLKILSLPIEKSTKAFS